MKPDMEKSIKVETPSPQEPPRTFVDRRCSETGRREPTSLRDIFALRPRRRRSRGRRGDDPGAYVDRYDARSWGIAIAVLVFSLVDTILTQFHLEMGTAEEANPVMRAILESGGYPAFYVAKIVMTVLPIIVILLHKEWTFGRYAARFCLWAYMLLTCWHAFLLVYVR